MGTHPVGTILGIPISIVRSSYSTSAQKTLQGEFGSPRAFPRALAVRIVTCSKVVQACTAWSCLPSRNAREGGLRRTRAERVIRAGALFSECAVRSPILAPSPFPAASLAAPTHWHTPRCSSCARSSSPGGQVQHHNARGGTALDGGGAACVAASCSRVL